jgi:RNA polymerase sigma-70 factor, ECF subfamily
MTAVPFRILRGDATERDSDVTLVQALKAGDRSAELVAWNRFAAGVDHTVRRLLGPGPDREDVVQEVFLRFFRRIGTLREAAAVRGFLTGICVHVVAGEIAARRRRRWFHLTRTGDLPESDATHAAENRAATDAREAVARYYRLLDRLGARERSIFVARTIEGLSLEEVATVHGVSVSTTQRRLRHASTRIATWVRRDPALAGFVARARTDASANEGEA